MAPHKNTQSEYAEPTALLDLVKLVFEKHCQRQGPRSKGPRQSPGAGIIKTPGEHKNAEPLASQLFALFDQLFGKQSQSGKIMRQSRRQAPRVVGQSAIAALYERRNLLNQKPAATDRRYKKPK